MLALLRTYSRKDRRISIVTQFYHPREITSQSTDAVDRLMQSGVGFNNQTVLLKGVNNTAKTLADLQGAWSESG